jgi:hypothetical protein
MLAFISGTFYMSVIDRYIQRKWSRDISPFAIRIMNNTNIPNDRNVGALFDQRRIRLFGRGGSRDCEQLMMKENVCFTSGKLAIRAKVDYPYPLRDKCWKCWNGD